MFRLSKATDYGIVLMAQLAGDPTDAPHNARELAEAAELPAPMVSKILKALAREGLLESLRGSKGGYRLARAPEDLPVSEMIRVLEGPVALTDCAIGPELCEHERMCAVREPWQRISRVVERALADVTLADLVGGRDGMREMKGAALPSAILQIERTDERNGRESGPSEESW
jgi:FeS assembly SUF system regulator